VETDNIEHLQAFLQPGAGATTCERRNRRPVRTDSAQRDLLRDPIDLGCS
jgi:hypothetical protein